MSINQRHDLLAGVLFVAIATVILFVAIPYGVQEPKKIKFIALSPSYYPRLVCYCLLFFGLLLTARQVFASKKVPETEDETNTKITPRLALIIVATFAFYYLSLSVLGFVLSSAIVLLALLLLAGDRNLLSLSLIPLLLPVSVYWFFTKVANIPIPTGILEPLLIGG